MKALSQLLHPGIRLLPGGGVFTLILGVGLLGLEAVGRQATSDLHDGLAGMALVALGALVAVRHRRLPLPWVERLGAWGRRAAGSLAGLRYEHGVDLRGTPPLPRRTPRLVGLVLLALAGGIGLAAASWAAFPHGWRAAGAHTVYVLYLAALLSLWAVLLACTFVGIFVPINVIDRWLKGWLGETDRRGAELAALVGYAVFVSGVAYLVPPAPILVVCLAVAAAAALVYLPKGGDGAAVLWRAGPGGPVYAVPLRRVLAAVTGLVSLAAFAVLLTACGGRLLGPADAADTMPVTGLLGAMAAWLMPGLLAVGGCRLFSARRNDPARRTPPTCRVLGAGPDAAAAARLLRGWGWRVRQGGRMRQAGDVGIEVVEPARSEAAEFDPQWPLKVSLADLVAGEVRPRLERRDEIQVRRSFFRGVARLFKRAAAFKGPGGGGLWLAPHWWFIEGVGREDADAGPDDSAAPKLVGPPYSRAFAPRARQHAHRVLRSTQIDMIYVEDGVGYRKVEKVLRVLMEMHDVHGGRQRADEMHFRGLPKVRVMVHDYEPDNPFVSDLYPEPKFDDLSRVRVLHVFRDRGGQEERVEPPFDFSWTPAPAGAMD